MSGLRCEHFSITPGSIWRTTTSLERRNGRGITVEWLEVQRLLSTQIRSFKPFCWCAVIILTSLASQLSALLSKRLMGLCHSFELPADHDAKTFPAACKLLVDTCFYLNNEAKERKTPCYAGQIGVRHQCFSEYKDETNQNNKREIPSAVGTFTWLMSSWNIPIWFTSVSRYFSQME